MRVNINHDFADLRAPPFPYDLIRFEGKGQGIGSEPLTAEDTEKIREERGEKREIGNTIIGFVKRWLRTSLG